MRVHLISIDLDGRNDIGRLILSQTRYFRRRGDAVRIYTQQPPSGVSDDIASLVEVTALDALAGARANAFWSGDLYVYHFNGAYALVETIRSLERGAVLFYYHGVDSAAPRASDRAAESPAPDPEIVRDLARFADYIVTGTPFSATELGEIHGVELGRTFTLPYPVPIEGLAPGPKDPAFLARHNLGGKRVILFAGRMTGDNGVVSLIEALPRIQERVPNAVLLFAGADVEAGQARAAALGVTDAVVFAGVDAGPAVCMRAADVYASASLSERFGTPIVEAMASGVPVVASDVAAHPSLIGDAGLLARAGDIEDLAAKIAGVLTDDGLHGDLVIRGLRRAQDFTLERYMAEWARIVSRAVAYLPRQPYPDLLSAPAHSLNTVFGSSKSRATAPDTAKTDPATQLDRARALLRGHVLHLDYIADVMKRGYVVRSKAPLVGPLIAWIRRNLTSHLREPYLDPMIEKQVAFNHHVAFTLRQILDAIPEQPVQPAKSGQRSATGSPDAPQPDRNLGEP